MTNFAGFKNEDFDFFLDYNESYAFLLKSKLEKLANAIKYKFPKELSRYSEIKVGNISKTIDPAPHRGAWVAIKKPEDRKDIFNQCNFTIEVSSSGLSINAVIRNGRVTEKRKPLGIFYDSLNNENMFLQIFKKFKSDLSIVMFKRLSKRGMSSSPSRGNEKWIRYFSMNVKDINKNEDVKWIQNVLKKADFPGVHFKKIIERGDPILSKPKELTDEILSVLIELSPILNIFENKL